eukprot:s4062_g12.t1
MCPPPKKSREALVEELSAELDAFRALHGRAPLKRDDVQAGQRLYDKLKKAKLLELLPKQDLRLRSLCAEVRAFLHASGRLPRRLHRTGEAVSDEQNREELLARRWARVSEEDLPQDLRAEFADLFQDDASQVRRLCEEARSFLSEHGRMPRRQRLTGKRDSEDKKREDALACRWARVAWAELSQDLQDEFVDLFPEVQELSAEVESFIAAHGRVPWRRDEEEPEEDVPAAGNAKDRSWKVVQLDSE